MYTNSFVVILKIESLLLVFDAFAASIAAIYTYQTIYMRAVYLPNNNNNTTRECIVHYTTLHGKAWVCIKYFVERLGWPLCVFVWASVSVLVCMHAISFSFVSSLCLYECAPHAEFLSTYSSVSSSVKHKHYFLSMYLCAYILDSVLCRLYGNSLCM